jgi:tetratricopeptide (TPR) repeat protein
MIRSSWNGWLVVAVAGWQLTGCGPQAAATNVTVDPVPRPAATQEKAKALSPAAEQHVAQGHQNMNSGLYDRAVDEFMQAHELDQENADVIQWLGTALVSSKRFEEAVKIYKRLADLKPNDCRAYAGVGFAYSQQGLADEAVKAYEDAVVKCPDDPSSYTNVGTAYQKAGYELEAIEAYRQAIELNPEDISTITRLADLYWDQKQYPQAIATYEAILANPANGKEVAWKAWASNRVAYMYKAGGAYAKAIPYYRTALAADVGGAQATLGLASCYEKTKQTDEAITVYRQLLQQVNDKPAYYYRLGELLTDAGRHEEAIEFVKRGQNYDNGCSAQAYCVVGRAHEKLGGVDNYQRAKRDFQKALECNDPLFNDYATKQIERQDQLVKIEELKRQKEKTGF